MGSVNTASPLIFFYVSMSLKLLFAFKIITQILFNGDAIIYCRYSFPTTTRLFLFIIMPGLVFISVFLQHADIEVGRVVWSTGPGGGGL